MSDSEGFDLDDEILELAGEGEKKRKAKRSAQKKSKRRRHEYVHPPFGEKARLQYRFKGYYDR
jgi:hypothetical protein